MAEELDETDKVGGDDGGNGDQSCGGGSKAERFPGEKLEKDRDACADVREPTQEMPGKQVSAALFQDAEENEVDNGDDGADQERDEGSEKVSGIGALEG